MLRFLPRYHRLASFLPPPPAVEDFNIKLKVPGNWLAIRPLSTTSCSQKIWTSKIPLPEQTKTVDQWIRDAVDSHVDKYPERTAIVSAADAKISLDFAQMKKSIHSLETFLYNIQFKKGDVATLLLPNCVEYPVIMGGVLSRGGIASTASPALTQYEIKKLLIDNQSKVVFTTDVLLPVVTAAVKKNPHVQTIVTIRQTKNPVPAGVIAWKTVMEAKGDPPPVENSMDDLAVLPYSSGTTGVPKGVMLTHRNVLAAVDGIREHYEKIVVPQVFPGVSGQEVKEKMRHPLVVFLPFYHIFGMAFLLMKVELGATIVQLPKFDPAVFLAALQQYKSWELEVAPPVALMLAKHPAVDNFDLSGLRFILSGAAPLPGEVGHALKKRLPQVNLIQGYGMTETSCLIALSGNMDINAIASVGPPGPGIQLKIVDEQSGRELDANERGEIVVAGPAIMQGYHNNPEETKRVLKEDGWFHTGDIGYVDDNGQLYIVDRIKELIKVNGLQVAPAQLEAVLAKNPKIADAAVIGIPHEKMGEAPKAFVVKADPSLTEEEVKKTVADSLAKHNWLVGGVAFVEEIPRSAAGKILRRLLKSKE